MPEKETVNPVIGMYCKITARRGAASNLYTAPLLADSFSEDPGNGAVLLLTKTMRCLSWFLSRGNPQSSQILVPAKKGLDASTYGQGRHMVKNDAEKSNNLGIWLETKSSPNEIVWVEAKMSNAFEAAERPPSAQEHLLP